MPKPLHILMLVVAGWCCAGQALSAAVVEAEAAAPAGRLRAFEKTYGPQVAVVLLATTNPEPLEDYANRLANTWRLGRKGIGDGVVIVLA